ncbi:transketolase [Candidatus Uhrbacteria bacterium CG10_big_fil_rev_8_21_14_0_10_50_16]|uniref:Transketolase n=1 Tax=Candidatus Uhrbacteria bacterium CG10_big_fil_rev_8_21_14_0_10_50_16 TaxID=1975039 RepID=A0A2H0RLY0_9BACT|nr:MAG: transketolase [Candidatus Uhrbacteria bacterium CG10_big_fil_rev_8_21_14_0_10_50_16]
MAASRKPALSPATYRKDVKRIPTRFGYGDGVVEAGKKNENVVVLCCDLTESTRSLQFKEAFPERFIQMGIAEQAMAAIAGGLALEGKIPFISSYAAFSPGRNWEQIRLCAAIQNQPIKIMGAHAGVSVGPDGATHQMLEDIALMRVLPNLTVISPCDYLEAKRAVEASIAIKGPVYIRFGRSATPSFTTTKTPFQIGRAEIFREGSDVAIIATGALVHQALLAAKQLEEKQIHATVVNCHTIKPLDHKTIAAVAKTCGAVVTVEEAQITGGLGGAVAECLARYQPTPMRFVGMQDQFGTSGDPEQLIKEFHLDQTEIVKQVLSVLNDK